MPLKTSAARLIKHGHPRAMSRSATRRSARVWVALATVGAVLAGIAVTAVPASAADPQFPGMWEFENVGANDINNFDRICMDADSSNPSNYGAIWQWDCDFNKRAPVSYDPYQVWTITDEGNGLYLLQNKGTGTCADADADNVGPYGEIIQWTACDPSDAFELFSIYSTGGSTYSIKSFGASNASIDAGGPALCVDANYGFAGDTQAIQQWPCDITDTYQLWNFIQITSIQ